MITDAWTRDIHYTTLATTYTSAFLSPRSSSAPSPSSPSPGVTRLASKNVLSEVFSGPSNVPSCADTYVCNNLQNEKGVQIHYVVRSQDAPDQLLLEIGIAPVALVTIRSVRRRLGQLPHEHGK